jgi:FdrA protein
MIVRALVKASEYHDSISLMVVARELAGLKGVEDAAVVMATKANKSILANVGLLTLEIEAASPNDLVIVVSSVDASPAIEALIKAEELLKQQVTPDVDGEYKPKTIRGALSLHPAANLAVISVAGRYATDEAWEALHKGLHVLLFSDNVSLEEEIALKIFGRDHGLLLMGPGAGTTILNHVALGFANSLPHGSVGIISAAGTGLQEVSTLLARRGIGISQGIGTGGRDLSIEVGGIMMLEALKALQEDPATTVLVLISKPPAEEIVNIILEQVSTCCKPTVVCFLGGDMGKVAEISHALPAQTLYECSLLAIRAFRSESRDVNALIKTEMTKQARTATAIKRKLNHKQRYLRGLFSGGTLCYESQVIWKELLTSSVHSNAPLPGGLVLPDSTKSVGHTAVDLGAEEFTVGRPHPMIDNDLRIRRLREEVLDPETAVIMLDVVLGYGTHLDPAAELGPAIREAHTLAHAANCVVPVVASVTGTENDPQGYSHTVSALERAGAIVCDSNAAAAWLVGMIVSA